MAKASEAAALHRDAIVIDMVCPLLVVGRHVDEWIKGGATAVGPTVAADNGCAVLRVLSPSGSDAGGRRDRRRGDRRLDLPIQPAKGYSVTYARPEHGPCVPLLLGEARVAVTPMGDRLRFAGTLELAGLDLSINRRRVEAIKRSAAEYFARIGTLTTVEIWRGLGPCTLDGLPIVGRPAAPRKRPAARAPRSPQGR